MSTPRPLHAPVALALCLLSAALGACSTAPSVERGMISTPGRGAVALAQDGDPLLGTGAEARRVSADFAKGYAKADIDNAHREYFARLRANTGLDPSANGGRPTFYDLTLPERADSTGIVRAPRPVILTITE